MKHATAAWLLLWPAAVLAQGTAALRDPMQPPARRAAPATTAVAAPAAPPPVVRQILVVGDERFVVDQGRRRRVGDQLGGLRIERIEDAAVVVRDGSTLRRLPLFAGVTKRAAATEPSPEPTAPTAPPPVAQATRR